MKILVISDSHGNVKRAFAICSLVEPMDAVIHLGDGSADAELLRVALDVPVINVAGNCDPVSNAPRELLWECEGKRFLLTHGDAYQVKSGLDRLRQRAEQTGVDAVLFGHTHLRLFEEHSGLLLINPGTISNVGNDRSYAILTVTRERIFVRHYTID